MSERRKYTRYETANPWTGHLTVLREVPVKPDSKGGLGVISRTPGVCGEVMRIALQGTTREARLRVKVSGSRPVTVDGTIRYALDLSVLDGAVRSKSGPRSQLGGLFAGPDATAVLTREVPVRTRSVSRSGCLLECGSPIDEGTVGRLRVRVHSRDCTDDVRVARVQRIEGAVEMYRLGVEFLWTRRPGQNSLRRMVTGLKGAVGSGVGVQSDLRTV